MAYATNANAPPMMVMTSPKTRWALGGFFYLLNRYTDVQPEIFVFGFDEDREDVKKYPGHFHSFGQFSDWPRNKWSDTFLTAINVMRNRDEIFWFMMDDYWLVRQVDMWAVNVLGDYMRNRASVLKMDLATDRLYAHRGDPYLYGKGTIDRVQYLDIIESDPHSPYHMSLWSGLWNTELLKKVIIPGESAQEIEVNGTQRLGTMPEISVLGTRQAPVLHTNIIRGGGPPVYTGYEMDGVHVNPVSVFELSEMQAAGVEVR